MSFSKKLKMLRLENEMTQDYVASRLNVARSTIAGYETKNRQPSHEKLAALANLFHVTIDYLLEDDEVIHMAWRRMKICLPWNRTSCISIRCFLPVPRKICWNIFIF